jgi:acyl-CoA reductase-like NAD-dependent aldehyde dehydrogenase
MHVTPVRIAGSPVTTDDTIEIRNPYSGAVVGLVPLCGPDQVDQACRSAAVVLAHNDFPQHQRAQVLATAAALLRERIEDFAQTIMLESAKPIRTARVEAARCVDTLTFAAVEARRLTGEMIADASESGLGKLMFALRVPIGVVAAITPFNFPLNLVAHKIAPAIAAGCPVVLKPAPQTPLSGIKLVELLVDAGMPASWISVVTDRGTEAAVPLVEHPVPRMITFTGSVDVGWGIRAAAPRKQVALELGSASPVIVAPDASIDALAAKIRSAGFAHAGQSCISVQRVIVHRSVYAKVREAVALAAESLVVGDPADEATDMGPLISDRATGRVISWIEDAVSRGAELITGGKVSDGILAPTVVDNPPRDTDLCAREVFGPVVVLLPYDDFSEAINIANDSPYGLHAGVFTNDLATAMRAMRELDFGGVLVNEVPTFRADHQPYGGVRDAGNTREGPAYAVQEMTVLRFVSLPSPV